MKNSKKMYFMVLLLFLTTATVQAKRTIEIASGEWAPKFSQKLKHEGVVSRIVRETFAIMGIDVKFVYQPWKRSMEMSKEGKWIGTPGWVKSEERVKHFYFSDPIGRDVTVLFHKKTKAFKWSSINDLKGLKVGGTTGYDYGKDFSKAEKQKLFSVERTSSDLINFKKLLAGRIDILPNDLENGFDIISSSFNAADAKQFTYHPKELRSADLHMLFSKKFAGNDKLVKEFNKALKQLKSSGKFDQYYKESRAGKYK